MPSARSNGAGPAWARSTWWSGSRSAVFAPLPRLGVVVVDEEDASAYKQDRVPRYHAVDVALELGRRAGVPVVLGSATPRVETYYRAHTGGLELTTLPERITGRALPPIEVVDLREELRAGNRSPLSLALARALEASRTDGGQSILYLNRRGTATVVLCRGCGEPLGCPNCSVALVYHAGRGRCDCHYCGSSRPLPDRCPGCGSARHPRPRDGHGAAGGGGGGSASRGCACSGWTGTRSRGVTPTSRSTSASGPARRTA